MSVIYANRKSTEKRADEDDKVRTITEVYIVKTDTDSDDQSVILNSNFSGNSATGAIALPQVGDSHPTDSLVTVKTRSLEPTDNRRTWNMTISYDNAVDSISTGGGGGGGPQVLKVTIGKWDETFIMEVDVKGKSFRNSATDKIKYESTRPQIMMTFSAQTQDPDFVKFQELQGTVNKAPINDWLGFNFLADQVLFDEYRATSVGNNTWQEDFIFKMRQVPDVNDRDGNGPDAARQWGWQPRLLDAGFNELKDVDGQKELMPILAKQKEADNSPKRAVSQPWPLDGAGKQLPADKIDQNKHFLEFKAYSSEDFSKFQFDFESILTRNEQAQLGLR
jgi:hypothetical protein